MENIFEKQINDFEDFGLKSDLLKSLDGFPPIFPTYGHIVGLTNIFQKKDLIIEGKEASLNTNIYSIGILQMIDPECQETQAIICSHSSEIAGNIAWSIRSLSKFMNVTINLTEENLEKFGQVVIGTIDKICINIMNYKLKTENLKIFIADEIALFHLPMTKKLFYETFKYLPSKIQIWFFGKSICNDIFEFSEFLMDNPERISLTEIKILEGVKQYYIELKNFAEKLKTLLTFYLKRNSKRFFIYCNQDITTEKLRGYFNENNVDVCVVNNSAHSINKNLDANEFRRGKYNVLITNDFNLKIQGISKINYIINFDMPFNAKEYVERVGCWPYKPNKWTVLNLIEDSSIFDNKKLIHSIEMTYETQIHKIEI